MTRSGIVIACAFVLAALPLAVVLNIWQDEAFTLHTTAAGIGYAFHEALAFEQSAPLYFVVLAAMRTLGSAVWYLRSFSIGCIAATILCAAPLARRYVPSIDPIYPTLVIAVNPLAMWAALEMRPYALIALCSALVLLTFYDAFLAENTNIGRRALFAGVATIALYTQFYLAFLILGLSAALLAYRRDRMPALLACGAVVALLFAPMLVVVPGQVANFRAPFPHPTLALSSASIAFPVVRYVLPAPVPAKLLIIVVTIALASLAIFSKASIRSPRWYLPFATLVAAGLFAVVTNAAGVLVLARHVTSLYVPAVLSVFVLIGNLDPFKRLVAARWWSSVAAAFGILAMLITYRPLAKPGDWIRVNHFIRDHERGDEPIAVFEAENALPFAHYYHGPNRIVAIPSGVDFRRYDLAAFIVHAPVQLSRAFPSAKRVWLLRAGGCQADGVTYGCSIVDAFIRTRYRPLLSRSFYGADVYLLEKIDERPTT
ncbi:MAG TPA: hypothetical protein VFN49_07155 [Candidatus Aquilonibacter sp.]|nr:hypothetical protein [Candidatus Aquilonibacter sp.]